MGLNIFQFLIYLHIEQAETQPSPNHMQFVIWENKLQRCENGQRNGKKCTFLVNKNFSDPRGVTIYLFTFNSTDTYQCHFSSLLEEKASLEELGRNKCAGGRYKIIWEVWGRSGEHEKDTCFRPQQNKSLNNDCMFYTCIITMPLW